MYKVAAMGFGYTGLAVMAAASLDAYGFDFLEGNNPLETSDGDHSFRSILKNLENMPSDDVPLETLTSQQVISVFGLGIAALCGFNLDLKGARVATTFTLAALGGNEAVDAYAGSDLASLTFYLGASSSMVGAGIAQAKARRLFGFF